MTAMLAAAVGLLAGIHTATWGMYKDAPHEGFSLWKYFRSILLATAIAVVIARLAGLDPRQAADLVVLFGSTYAVERGLAEWYKTFLREEDQSKYFIPMQFAIFGKVVKSRGARLAAGAGYIGMLAAMVLLVLWVDRAVPKPHPILLTVLVGGIGGWISAFGGAWKDAPIEGFETLKFFRSPLFAAGYAFILSRFTDSYFLIPLGALGFTIATLETYKTFFFPSKPRGKFAGKPVLYPDMLRRRNWFIPVYAAIWLALIVTLVLGLT